MFSHGLTVVVYHTFPSASKYAPNTSFQYDHIPNLLDPHLSVDDNGFVRVCIRISGSDAVREVHVLLTVEI